jgi:UDP-2,3-diacylglucosamine hydrolase
MTAPGALPVFWEFGVPDTWRCVDLISDLHLAESAPATFDAFAAHLRHTDADAVFILGDLFEVWVGDDARHQGFEARCADVLAEASSRRSIGFMAGNRDFLVGAEMLKACGVLALSDPTVLVGFGERLLLTHGDLLCSDDIEYQAFRREVRGAAWQAAFLARPLAERRALAAQMRERSMQVQAARGAAPGFDIDPAMAVRWMHEAGTPTLVHGHTHRPGSDSLAPGFVRHVLSDWDLDDANAPRAEVLRWKRSGLIRSAPSRAR